VCLSPADAGLFFAYAMLSFVYSNIGRMDMQKIELEHGIRLPPVRVVFSYPYETMAVGDSFTVPVEARPKVLNANYKASKRLNMKFMARTKGDIVRVWRVE